MFFKIAFVFCFTSAKWFEVYSLTGNGFVGALPAVENNKSLIEVMLSADAAKWVYHCLKWSLIFHST